MANARCRWQQLRPALLHRRKEQLAAHHQGSLLAAATLCPRARAARHEARPAAPTIAAITGIGRFVRRHFFERRCAH
jgi:hypothetical protein